MRRSKAGRRARSSTSPTAAPRPRGARSSSCCATLGPRRHRRASSPRLERQAHAVPAPSRSATAAAPRACRTITTCARATSSLRRLHGNLAAAAERGAGGLPRSAADAGRRRANRAGAGAWSPRSSTARRAASADPARFSLAHGGKDRHPFPVPIKVYDETIRVLKSAVPSAKLGHDEKLGAHPTARRAGARAGTARRKARRSRTLLAEERAQFAPVWRPQRFRLGAARRTRRRLSPGIGAAGTARSTKPRQSRLKVICVRARHLFRPVGHPTIESSAFRRELRLWPLVGRDGSGREFLIGEGKAWLTTPM